VAAPGRWRHSNFPKSKGKTIDEVELDPDGQAIVILFQDNHGAEL
jgi:hypothetical protein